MALSAKCVSKLADALKEDIINQIYEDERYMEMMTDMVGDALREKLGDIDDDLYFDLGMVLIDRIELKQNYSPPNVLYSVTTDFMMTLIERNQKLYELREKLTKARAEVAWIEQEIWLVRDQYDRQDLDLYKEMFGDTPMAEEIYGG